MYSTIRGIVTQIHPSYIVLEASGIGFKLLAPSRTVQSTLGIGSELLLHTSYVVREFSQALYGFSSLEERDLFELLIEISGIGPKIALGLISHLTLPELEELILSDDLKTLCQVPGIGKKTAERLLVELRNKLSHFFQSLPLQGALPVLKTKQQEQDALKALVNLGYSQSQAHKAIRKTLEQHEELEDLSLLITHSLKNLH
jgi:holliday junction DNA helicase RuvA